MNKSERALDFLFLGLQQDTLLQLFLVSLLCKQNQSISQLRPMGQPGNQEKEGGSMALPYALLQTLDEAYLLQCMHALMQNHD